MIFVSVGNNDGLCLTTAHLGPRQMMKKEGGEELMDCDMMVREYNDGMVHSKVVCFTTIVLALNTY